MEFKLGLEYLSSGKSLSIASGETKINWQLDTREKIKQSWKTVQNIASGESSVYGINTGFGPLCTTKVSEEDTKILQKNILISHSAGVGPAIPVKVAKLMLVLKAHSLSFGYSGISMEVLERIKWHVDYDYIPEVPLQGSVGASGDLAPLAHLFLPLIGLGKLWNGKAFVPSMEVLQKHQLEPLTLGAKEGLALINGTQFIAASAIVALEKFFNILETADLAGALSIEALMGSMKPYDPRLHELRPHPGAQFVAKKVFSFLHGSEILNSHKDCDRVQDPYSLRCIPQVHGTSWDSWIHLKEKVEVELNSVTDNPVVFSNNETISGGNFHGQPLAMPLDYLSMAASEIGNISDRRIYLLLEGRAGLPVLLMEETGVNSGFMLAQYTSAALASENKTLCFPASVDSIPTSLGQEDHVSMGPISGRKALKIMSNLENILALELLCAAQAMDFRRPLKSTPVLEACHQLIREHIDFSTKDKVFYKEIQTLQSLVTDGSVRRSSHKGMISLEKEFKDSLYESYRIY